MRILLLSRYTRMGASSRLRTMQYIPYLNTQGIKVTVAPLLNDIYLQELYTFKRRKLRVIIASYLKRLWKLTTCGNYDLLWIEKELFPWFPALAEHFLAAAKIPYVVDYDDALFHTYDSNPYRCIRILLGRKIDAVMRKASLVIVGNEYLAKHARNAHARQVEIIPTVVDLKHYPLHNSPLSNIFSIGWIGTPVTVKYLFSILPALQKVCADRKAHLIILGAESFALNGIPLSLRRWSEATEVDDIQTFDVGIMPLPDSPWERGKCGYKLIQYMACRKPVVASPVGMNHKIVQEEKNGFLAHTNDEWVHALQTLQSHPELRAQMGSEGRASVESGYCLNVTGPRLSALLRQAAGND